MSSVWAAAGTAAATHIAAPASAAPKRCALGTGPPGDERGEASEQTRSETVKHELVPSGSWAHSPGTDVGVRSR
jgi:hypothetical protein